MNSASRSQSQPTSLSRGISKGDVPRVERFGRFGSPGPFKVNKLRDKLLNRKILTTLTEAKVLIEQWRREYNQVCPHSSLGYCPPAPKARIPVTLT